MPVDIFWRRKRDFDCKQSKRPRSSALAKKNYIFVFRSSREPSIIRAFFNLLSTSKKKQKNGQTPVFCFLAQEEGFSPLAVRPAPPLLMASFAASYYGIVI